MEKRKRLIYLLSLLFFTSHSAFSQSNTDFNPSGKIIARGFFDFSTGIGNETKESGYDITRALLGYNYKFTKNLQGQIVLDAASGKNDKGNLQPHLRNAFVTWKDEKLCVSAGLVGLLQFKIQEEYWAHRYVFKSLQDENKMGSSVDAGITAQYTFSPAIAADISIINGEGYKKIEKNNSTLYGLGVSASPTKGLLLRAYGDIYTESEECRDALPSEISDTKYKNQYILSLFAGYKNDKISAGIEYSHQMNKGFIEDKNSNGYSAYTTVNISDKWNVYGRYDLLDSSSPDTFISSWNKLDGQLMILGTEFTVSKQLKISPNLRNINPRIGKSEQYLFVNVELNL